ncbi:MAG: hypothetical protein IKQ46_13060 [Bacteroidales bacterium]|jgi:hypothetical protein|nr:hypothetical protein [Bacteroidales bacterium]
MKLISKTLGIAVTASALLSIQACTNSSNNNQGQTPQEPTQEIQEAENTTFYLLPSPEDFFAFSAEKLKYSSVLLNATEKSSEYIDSRSQELNFGIYCADMAYCAVNGQYQDATKYLNTLKDMSAKLGLETVFTQALANRVDQYIQNKDSLKQIANDAYFDIKKALETQSKNATIAQISAGGWIECMYIITNSIDNFSTTDINIRKIADEKVVFESLVAYLEQFKNKPGVQETIDIFKPVEEAYQKLEVVVTENNSVKTNSDAIVLGGNQKIEISEDNFNVLRTRIAEIRKMLTNNK